MMLRKGMLVLGLALGLLAALGLHFDHRATLLWFGVIAAVLSVGETAIIRERELGATRGIGPGLIGLGLAAVWIVGLHAGRRSASPSPSWAAWATFVFACAYLGLGIAAARQGRRRTSVPAVH
jgi:hypothetical protein